MSYEQFMVEYPEAGDAWLDAMPEDVYTLCPCGCGRKWKYVSKEPETIGEHEIRFYQKVFAITVLI